MPNNKKVVPKKTLRTIMVNQGRSTNSRKQKQLLIPIKPGNTFEIVGEESKKSVHLVSSIKISNLMSEEPEENALTKGLIENIPRKFLNPIEEAEWLDCLMKEFNFTHHEVAKYLGRSRTKISNLLRLLDLDDRVKMLLISGDLKETHGRNLAGQPKEEQFALARKTISKNWSTRELEREIHKKRYSETKYFHSSKLSTDSKNLEKQLSKYLSAGVILEEKGGKEGEIKISYKSLDELKGILIRIGLLKQAKSDFNERGYW